MQLREHEPQGSTLRWATARPARKRERLQQPIGRRETKASPHFSRRGQRISLLDGGRRACVMSRSFCHRLVGIQARSAAAMPLPRKRPGSVRLVRDRMEV
jgi:hypothetical protein